MQIEELVPLAHYSTMRLGGTAAYACIITSPEEIAEAIAWAEQRGLVTRMIGGGSNIIWKDEGFGGLLMVNAIPGYTQDLQSDGTTLVTIGAGETWDGIVAKTVEAGLTGIEALSLIPGTSGATPIQNVGAYGQEIANVLEYVTAFDQLENQVVTLRADDCDFGYRTSRFKAHDSGRFYISSITLRLRSGDPEAPFYPALARLLEENNITQPTPKDVREAVIAIRSSKLPDPAVVANNGSFFANPIINQAQFDAIQVAQEQPVPHWPTQEGLIKISAAWLLEQAGFKDYHDSDTGMATWHAQPLVLINESAKTTADLLTFKKKLVTTVQAKFGVELVQEPELLPTN